MTMFGNLTLPLLAQYLGGGKDTIGGELMLGFVSAVAIATILAVVAGLTLQRQARSRTTCTSICSRKAWSRSIKQIWVARITAVLVGIVATLLGILAEGSERGGPGHLSYLHRR